MPSIYKKRRKAKAICNKCQSPDYKQEPPYYPGGKPNFVCNSCGATWQYGYDGGKYSKLINQQ